MKKLVPFVFAISLGIVASAKAQSRPMPTYSAPTVSYTPAPAPVYHEQSVYNPPVHTYNPAPMHTYEPSAQSASTYHPRTQRTESSSSNEDTPTRTHHGTASSYSDAGSTSTHTRSSSSSTRRHQGTTGGSSTASSESHPHGSSRKRIGTGGTKAPIAQLHKPGSGTGGMASNTASKPGKSAPLAQIHQGPGPQITGRKPQVVSDPLGDVAGSGVISRTPQGLTVNVAPYGVAPLITPVSVSPGYFVALGDPRVIGFYDGSVAQAEWSPEVEDQWDTALQTEFCDMAVQDGGTQGNPPTPPPAPASSGQFILAAKEKDLAKSDKLEYEALLNLALKLNAIKDPAKAVAAENKFLKRSSAYLDSHPDEVALWILRARLAVHINQEDIGREAGQNLKRLVDAGCDDTKWHGLMVELSAREWLAAA